MIVLAGALLAFSATAQIQYSNEFWISTNATGNIFPNGGTLNSPLDGSTEATFDTNMNSLPAHSLVHILAGTYQTYGNDGWAVKTGDKIVGSGIDVTVLQLVTNTPSPYELCYVIASSYSYQVLPFVTNVEVSDLTCDCNYAPGEPVTTPAGVDLDGTFNAVRRVKVIHAAFNGGTSEGWGIVLQNFQIPSSIGNIIEECEVSQFAGGGGMSQYHV